jgi:anaerobic selenocysteine-containing dehydrogenase
MRKRATSLEKRAEATADLQIRKTTCYMCACRCGIRVHLRDGEVRYIDGNPDHPLNGGVICAKGSSGIMKQYSPARLTKPLLRKPGSERGAGEFIETTWEHVEGPGEVETHRRFQELALERRTPT